MARLRGSALVLAALSCAAAAVIAAPAGGAANARVTVGIGYEPSGPSPFFRGAVKSARKSCVANRPVKVYLQRNEGARRIFGSTRSDANGFWRIPLRSGMPVGGYVAVVKAKAGCAKAVSDPIPIR